MLEKEKGWNLVPAEEELASQEELLHTLANLLYHLEGQTEPRQ